MIRALGGALLCLLSGLAGSVERLHVELGSVEAAHWRVQDAVIGLELGASEPTLSLRIARVDLGDYTLDALRLDCKTVTLDAVQVSCDRAVLGFSSDGVRATSLPASLSWRFADRQLKVSARGLLLAGGKVDIDFSRNPAGWRLQLHLDGTGADGLAALARRFSVQLPVSGLRGSLDGSVELSGEASTVRRVAWTLRGNGLGYDSEQGDQAAEDLRLSSRGQARRDDAGWRVKAALDARDGVLYSEPLYLEFSPAQPLRLTAGLDWRSGQQRLVVEQLRFEQPGLLRGTLSASLGIDAPVRLETARLQLDDAALPAFYQTWLQPWLAGTPADMLETTGRLGGVLVLEDNAIQSLRLDLDHVGVREKRGVFGVRDLDGTLYWGGAPGAYTSRLRWAGANVYRLAFGPAELALQTQGRQVRMTQPLVVTLLDGELHVDSFELGQDAGGFRWSMDGMLTPVSMRAFSSALGWMPLSGKLSGMIPKMHYENGELTLGGILLVQAFDGDITLRNLRIRQPFGRVPRLWADARINKLDLETLTRTFDVGRIEGRLSGEVNHLYMEAWQTVAFDAWLATPRDDRSRHRISQRAVDTISNIGGGGVGGAVSRTLLRFLEDFPYRRLGIRCRLENGICHMRGVADLPSGNGYYLVQGRLLPPRLDVIGYSRQVDWMSLLDRLRSETGAIQVAP